MLSLYGQYIKERENKEIVESHNGFATYQFFNDFCYIVDVYVVPEYRGSKLSAKMVDEIAKIAKKASCGKLITSVCVDAVDNDSSLKAILNYGFKLKSCDKNMIYFEKSLEA